MEGGAISKENRVGGRGRTVEGSGGKEVEFVVEVCICVWRGSQLRDLKED